MDDETRECLLELASAIEHLASAVGRPAGEQRPQGVTEAGLAAQEVITRLHGGGATEAMSINDGLGGAVTGGGE